ncbi:hypothetical protein MNBD_ALPHA05-1566, partial [hydrothermal vent metagenome]
MSAAKPKVAVTRKLPQEVEARLCDLFDTTLNESDAPLTRAALIARASDADVLAP